MINYQSADLSEVAVHYIGVPHMEDALLFSDKSAFCRDELSKELLIKYICSSFTNPEYFAFDIQQDSLYPIVKDIFNDPTLLFSRSKAIAERLYQKSEHPAIKSGELVVALLEDLVIEDECLSGIAIFKLESKNTFLKIDSTNNTYDIHHDIGIGINQAEKGCLILNTSADSGYKIVSLDKRSRVEANYWALDFLNMQARSDDYHYTEQYIQMTKSFIQDTAKKEGNLSKVAQADILNKSQNFFNENIQFNDADYQKTVFESDDLGKSFGQYKQAYEQENDVAIAEDFEISDSAVKNNARVFKSVIKLDKNFHIYVHGDRDKIEKGLDNTGRKFYKIFYEEEK